MFGMQHHIKKVDVNDCSFAQLTLILLLHYLVKCRKRSLAIYNNEFIVGNYDYCILQGTVATVLK